MEIGRRLGTESQINQINLETRLEVKQKLWLSPRLLQAFLKVNEAIN